MSRYSIDPDGLDGVFNPEKNTEEVSEPDQQGIIEPKKQASLEQTPYTTRLGLKRLPIVAFLATLVATSLVAYFVVKPFGHDKKIDPFEKQTPSTSQSNTEANNDTLFSDNTYNEQNQLSKPIVQKNETFNESAEIRDELEDNNNRTSVTGKNGKQKSPESISEYVELEEQVEDNIPKMDVLEQNNNIVANDGSNAVTNEQMMSRKDFPETSPDTKPTNTDASTLQSGQPKSYSQPNISSEQNKNILERSDKNSEIILTFDFDTKDLSHLQQSEKVALIAFAKGCNDNIAITGHTCNIGSSDINWAVGLARAEATKNFLSQEGVSANKIKINSLGEKQPIASNDTLEGRKQNRFVAIRCSGY